MAKKKVTCEVYAQVQVPDGTDPEVINNILQRACNNQGWSYTGGVIEGLDLDSPIMLQDLLEEGD